MCLIFTGPGPVVTWMIENDVGFLANVEKPYALGGLIGGLFFAGYMLTQFPGGYLGDKYGHRTIIVISLIWAGILGITIATVFAPNLIALGGSVFADGDDAWRMPFLVLGAATLVVGIAVAAYFRRQEPGLPYAKATLHLLGFSAVGLAAVMGVYFVGNAAGLSDLWIAILEVGLALCLVAFVFSRRQTEMGAVLKNRDLVLINLAFIAVLWNLWFFSFWSVSIVADAAGSSFGRSAMIAAFNAGAGILGFPTGGWLSDLAVRRGLGRKPLVVLFTALQCVLTIAFGFVVAAGAANVWLMAALLFSASTFFNAMQPIAQAMLADIADPAHHGAAFGMNNLIGEIGAVLSPAVSGALRDATGGWSTAVFVDAALIGGAVILFLLVREASGSGGAARRTIPAGRYPANYGVVVDSVNVRVFA